MNPERKLILLPMDGSDRSMEVVKYISKAMNLANAEIVFLSIIDKTPDVFWDTERDPTVSMHMEHMKSWDTYKEQKMQDRLKTACKILEAAGVPKSAVTCNLQKRQSGIARDIIAEAKFGYDLVALARSGLGRMDDSMLGSIAAKVFINVSDAPICLLGGKPKAGKILVGLDNSLGSVRVVNFVCKMLNASNQTVCLAHVVRIPETVGGEPLDENNVSKITREHEAVMKPVFENAIKSLTSAGFAPENISTKLITTGGGRAANLFTEASAGKFGAIVVGRRGTDDVAEFSMGRVAYKLGYIAKNVALWVIA
ncbi:MAG: universal stress protein [Syntrophobacteraceae bacterium]|jgi:nucleotide-binding universal stress UspA family protein